MKLSRADREELRTSLRQAAASSAERCLYHTFKWTAEMLHGLPDDVQDDDSAVFNDLVPPVDAFERSLEMRELPKYLMAKALFDCKEFLRCAFVFLPLAQASWPSQERSGQLSALKPRCRSQKALFLSLYAFMIAGEKLMSEERGSILGPMDTGAVVNQNLLPIKRILEAWFEEVQEPSYPRERVSYGWLEYLYGIVVAKERNTRAATTWLLKSVAINPWNWGAWQELSSLVRNASHLQWIQSQLSPTVMGFIFSVFCRQELRHVSTSLINEISQLEVVFPKSAFLKSQRAAALYSMKDAYAANSLFSTVISSDPRRLDMMDYYSNVLFSLDSRDKLAFIAQLCSAVDRYRPETSCVIGNYYSLCNQHEDAVAYFRQALVLDRNFSGAWTLLGHEYLHLQNTHAATECYRRAISITAHDYRSFFGLGRCYDLFDLPNFASYYYRRAARLRPNDPQLWEALADCLTGMSLLPQAAKALETAILSANKINMSGPMAWKPLELLYKLALLYKEIKGMDAAVTLLDRCLEEYSVLQGQAEANGDELIMLQADNEITSHIHILRAQWAVKGS